jgi:phosphopantothenoylcysteine decarboxylase/phosphopantothenate--cysteine ligase
MSADRLKVTVAVCGGIAAYKAVELVRLLQNSGLDPHVVMTSAATRFVQPLTFAAISGHKVITSLWSADHSDSPSQDTAEPNLDSAIDHIHEAQSTRALIVAPATADILAKFAHGIADDFLTTLYLATTAPVLVAPAMNVNMWNHPATQANLQILRQRGVTIVAPDAGYLACGMVGSGRLADNATIAATLASILSNDPAPATTNDLAGQTVLITAGGTREPIDPVRYIGNRSSGRMGYALAAAAQQRGARVLLISAPTALPAPPACELIPVTTADDMRTAVLAHLPEATLVIMAAAVSDYRVTQVATHKLHRDGPRTLTLEPTRDILHEIATLRRPGTLVIGFAAETPTTQEDPLANARAKLQRKAIDAIVFNDVSLPGLGFDSDRNAGTFLTPTRTINIPPMSKTTMANRILDETLTLRAAPIPAS